MEYQQLMIKKTKEEALLKVKDYFVKNAKQKITAKDAKILELKEAKINTIKCLRRFTDFSKSNFEDILKENFELKKNLLTQEAHVKILKVAILKLKAQLKIMPDHVEDFTEFGPKPTIKEVSKNEKSLDVRLKPPVPKSAKGKAGALSSSSVSTAASQNSENLQQEILTLKKQWQEKEQEYKIQLSRMKTFYDKHLTELNLNKMGKQDGQHAIQKISKETPLEATVRDLRTKVLEHEADKKKMQKVIEEKETKIIDLKNRIANQGFTKLTKVIEELNTKLQARDQLIAEKEAHIKEIDTLDYQLRTKYESEGPNIAKLVSVYLWARKLISDPVLSFTKECAGICLDFALEAWITPVQRLLWAVWVNVRDRVWAEGVDTRAMVLGSLKEWGEKYEREGSGDNAARYKIAGLEDRIWELERENKEYKFKVDAIVNLGEEARHILKDIHKTKSYIQSAQELQEELDKEEAMPPHLKKLLPEMNARLFNTNVKYHTAQDQLAKARERITELEFVLESFEPKKRPQPRMNTNSSSQSAHGGKSNQKTEPKQQVKPPVKSSANK